ncbi:amidase [Thioalkalivibrio sp. HK1]|uniref:amidase n=1 Tax=Thioalkalivibrio sp. HK1 TaxID=1469245 RepID=UPI000471F9EB|nr:amidase [Thioalkalivibrio sp. HK1]
MNRERGRPESTSGFDASTVNQPTADSPVAGVSNAARPACDGACTSAAGSAIRSIDADDPACLDATEAAARIRLGTLSCEALMSACLRRIEAREHQVGAWAFIDPDRALAQARRCDRDLAQGRSPKPLHGIPVGIKDIIDTDDMPTQLGSPIHEGRRPDANAQVVSLLRAAGAIILGKTVTTEFALSHPGKTRNPHALGNTPGGSSSGSAAAVADCMVPLSLGSQTIGSVIRPGSFCGVFAYKPSFGSIPTRGMHLLSPRLDHVGIFARSLDDLALAADVLMQPDPFDADIGETPPARRPQSLTRKKDAAPPGRTPRLAFVPSPYQARESEDARTRRGHWLSTSGLDLPDVRLPPEFERADDIHRTILGASLAAIFAEHLASRSHLLSEKIIARIEAGQAISAERHSKALDAADHLARTLDEFLSDYDAILTQAAPGTAPSGLDSTGDPIFNGLWTLAGTPAINLPLLQGEKGLPLGMQIVSGRNRDADLFEAAHFLMRNERSGSQ